MSPTRHALLVSSPQIGAEQLARQLGSTWGRALTPLNAAILSRGKAGELEVLVACDGVLGRIVGRRVGAASLVGTVSLIALALSGVADQESTLGPFRDSIRPSIPALAASLPVDSSALLLVVESASSEPVPARQMLLLGTVALPISFSADVEPWLLAGIDVDLRVEPRERLMQMADAS